MGTLAGAGEKVYKMEWEHGKVVESPWTCDVLVVKKPGIATARSSG